MGAQTFALQTNNMRINVYIKSFFYFSVISILLLLYKSVIDLKYTYTIPEKTIVEYTSEVPKIGQENVLDLKYILQWTSSKNVPFVYMGKGQEGFISRNCSYTNCFVTNNRTFLGDYTKFDVIAFAGPEVRFMNLFGHPDPLPLKRSPHQKYAFASIESADNYPICSDTLNRFFNWTWTYRLESEAKWGYIVIRDAENNIVGPKTNMHWMQSDAMDSVSVEIKEKLRNKTKAGAWFVSNCVSRSKRENYARDLNIWLAKYDLHIDIYGQCSSLTCPRDKEEECNKMIERDYYFYLSFENSFAEDYVTEKLLHPLQYLAVPIVYGGANYTRQPIDVEKLPARGGPIITNNPLYITITWTKFMPDNIYLDARELGPEKLASKINELIENPDLYEEYFKWKKYYSYHRRFQSIETDDYCRFCSMLNDENLVKKTSIYEDFRSWWDPPNRC